MRNKHIHYKNFRFDFTVRDFLEFFKGMMKILHNLMDFKNMGNEEMDITLRGMVRLKKLVLK